MPSPLGTALISTGADLAGSLVGGLFGQNQSKKAWKEQAHYNSPAEQMKRLKLAGLNPNLVYGNGSVANTMNNSYDTAKPDAGDIGTKGLQAYVSTAQLEMQKDLNALQQLFIQSQIADKVSLIKFRDNVQTDKTNADIDFTLTALDEKKKLMSWIDSDKSLDQKLKHGQLFKTNLEASKLNQEIEAFPIRLQNEILETRAKVRNLNVNSNKQEVETALLNLVEEYRKQGIEVNDHILFRQFYDVIGGTKSWFKDLIDKHKKWFNEGFTPLPKKIFK